MYKNMDTTNDVRIKKLKEQQNCTRKIFLCPTQKQAKT